ncbi:MAG: EpsI family protein [Methylibium sp.]|uniref:exosortase-associated protein EpsI, B-type n=1 Tax=Methylibium sp. TaxID=2067992 RepID=UPI0017915A68|nr:exosortase-associated protein EpsI, B-type [Methylibium sp.]MBA2722749.1 EpsI family protein [Methylibium sp.]MBA3590198.1 EpsI family protein [Methylibium sp.]MBA3623054.1 EpsI family protein [Methylibium sp.]
MKLNRRKAIVAVAAMGSAAAAARTLMPTRKLADLWHTDLEQMFPATFGDWEVDKSLPVVLPSPDTQALLDKLYNQVLARAQLNRRTGERVMLSVAYGGDQSEALSAHLPEVCYPAQGFTLDGAETVSLELAGRNIPARRMRTRSGHRHEPVTYWLTLGETVAATRMQRKLQQVRFGLRGWIPDGMLVRVSTIDTDATHGFAVQYDYLRSLAASVPAAHASRVLGASDT